MEEKKLVCLVLKIQIIKDARKVPGSIKMGIVVIKDLVGKWRIQKVVYGPQNNQE